MRVREPPAERGVRVELVLSLFPGIGILDSAFEREGFCVVRGPDLLWGGDVRRFRPPPGAFGGVVGGPPCQAHSSLVHLVRHAGARVAEDLIPEFERVVAEAAPAWFLMENVRGAPVPAVPGYLVHAPLFDNRQIGGEQSRVHRFSFGTGDGRSLDFGPELRPENPRRAARVCASGVGRSASRKIGEDGKPEASRFVRAPDLKTNAAFREGIRLHELPAGFDLPGFTVAAKIRALGNAVPYGMARALARTVRRALGLPVLQETGG